MMYFGFALADSMFTGNCEIARRTLTPDEAVSLINYNVTPCLNPSHQATINAMTTRYGINVTIPERPPQVNLNSRDSIIIMGVRGLPRLTDRHEYTEAEIESATFSFAIYFVN